MYLKKDQNEASDESEEEEEDYGDENTVTTGGLCDTRHLGDIEGITSNPKHEAFSDSDSSDTDRDFMNNLPVMYNTNRASLLDGIVDEDTYK